MNKLLFITLMALLLAALMPGYVLAEGNPEGAKITFTFDDGAKTIYHHAMPILAEYNFPAVLFSETGPINSGEEWIMTWDQVRNLRDTYGWEIGSHTITHPYLTRVSDQQLVDELLGSKQDFATQGIEVKSFATPYGDYNVKVVSEIAKYYQSHRAAWGGPNHWPDTYNDYELVCLEAAHNISPMEVQSWVDRAIANDQWLILLFHSIVEDQPEPYEYNVDDFAQIIDYVASKPITVTTISQGLSFSDQPNLISNYTFSDLDDHNWAKSWLRNNIAHVNIDTNNHGNVFGPENSLKITGGPEQYEARTESVTLDGAQEYLLRMYQNVQDLITGGWALWVNEFDYRGDWLGGQWLGGNYANFVGNRYYQYQPTSATVAEVQMHIYTEENSQLTLYVDSVELRAVGLVNPNPNLEDEDDGDSGGGLSLDGSSSPDAGSPSDGESSDGSGTQTPTTTPTSTGSTPTPTSTTTYHSTPTPTLVPTSGPYVEDIADKVAATGTALDTILFSTSDGAVSITIPANTTALNEDGEALDRIIIVPLEEPPAPLPSDHAIGLTYNLLPEGAYFDPPIQLTMRYDPSLLRDGMTEEDLIIAFYDEEQGWVELETTIDAFTHTAIAKVSYFTEFSVLAGTWIGGPNDGSTAALSSASVSWALVGGILGSFIVISLAIAIFLRRRSRRPAS